MYMSTFSQSTYTWLPERWMSQHWQSLKGNQSENASWPPNLQNVQIFPSSLGCSTNIYATPPPPPPPPPTELLRAQSGWSNPYQGQKKGWLVTHLILLPHMPALFKRSLKQTAGPKMAARTAMFSQLSNVHFFHQQDGESVPKPAAYFFFFIPLFQQGLWCFFGLVPL